MPRETKYCIAPRPYNKSQMCGQPFLADVPTQLYCSSKCANRMHRMSAARNKLERLKAEVRTLDAPLVPISRQAVASAKAAAAIDQEAELAKLGYAANPKDLSKERREELGLSNHKPKFEDRSAEPKRGLPPAGEPPQFDNSDLEDEDPFGYRR